MDRKETEKRVGAELNWSQYRVVVDHETGKRYGEAPELEAEEVVHRFLLEAR
jgi:hypothetical protein